MVAGAGIAVWAGAGMLAGAGTDGDPDGDGDLAGAGAGTTFIAHLSLEEVLQEDSMAHTSLMDSATPLDLEEDFMEEDTPAMALPITEVEELGMLPEERSLEEEVQWPLETATPSQEVEEALLPETVIQFQEAEELE